MLSRTFVMLKPDAVQRGLMGAILTRFEQTGLKIVGMKMVWVTQELSRKHYVEHVDKPFYKGLEKFITEGPVLALAVEGLHAVETVRKIVGGTEPKAAQPGTIRGDFAHHSYEYTNAQNIAVKNLIHASGNAGDAKRELELWFKPEELHTYHTVHETHVF
ncbi:nucleoside-diphosphate kinase [Candidatus Woesearchaeota archaeon]|nr:nucleoside-diphosphate kinase [Candidatus Woesearchaeota archaeon]